MSKKLDEEVNRVVNRSCSTWRPITSRVLRGSVLTSVLLNSFTKIGEVMEYYALVRLPDDIKQGKICGCAQVWGRIILHRNPDRLKDEPYKLIHKTVPQGRKNPWNTEAGEQLCRKGCAVGPQAEEGPADALASEKDSVLGSADRSKASRWRKWLYTPTHHSLDHIKNNASILGLHNPGDIQNGNEWSRGPAKMFRSWSTSPWGKWTWTAWKSIYGTSE